MSSSFNCIRYDKNIKYKYQINIKVFLFSLFFFQIQSSINKNNQINISVFNLKYAALDRAVFDIPP